MDVLALATRQLAAYNAADLDGFCACYHEDVVVLDDGVEQVRGIEAFRARYAAMFARGGFGASVPGRLAMGRHCVEHERYWRETEDGRVEGEVIVRYTEREGRIAVASFLRA